MTILLPLDSVERSKHATYLLITFCDWGIIFLMIYQKFKRSIQLISPNIAAKNLQLFILFLAVMHSVSYFYMLLPLEMVVSKKSLYQEMISTIHKVRQLPSD